MITSARRLDLAVLMVFALALPRCAGLFNQGRLDEAKEAHTAFTDAKLAESLDAERMHTATLHVRELSVTERQSVAIRDAELQQIIGATPVEASNILTRRIGVRLKEIGGAGAGARTIAGKFAAIAKQEQALESLADAYRLKKTDADPAPACPKSKKEKEKLAAVKISDGAGDDWRDFQAACDDLAKLRTELDELQPAGEYAEIDKTLRAVDTQRADIRTQIEAADKAFKDEKKRLDAERAASKPVDLRPVAENLKKQLDKLDVPDQQSIDVPGFGPLNAEAKLKWLELQQDHVSKLLAAAAAADLSAEVPPGVDDDLQIASALPGIASQLSAGLRFPRVSALILQSEHLRLEADRLRAEIVRVDQHLKILRSRRNLMTTEVGYLVDATTSLATCTSEHLAAETFAKLPDACRNAFTSTLISYANSWTLGRIPETKLDWAVVQLQHDKSLDHSVSALAQWQNLIGVPLSALVTSYESGVKAENIGRTLNAAGLGWIGLGVH